MGSKSSKNTNSNIASIKQQQEEKVPTKMEDAIVKDFGPGLNRIEIPKHLEGVEFKQGLAIIVELFKKIHDDNVAQFTKNELVGAKYKRLYSKDNPWRERMINQMNELVRLLQSLNVPTEKSKHTYMIHGSEIKKLGRIPSHEEAKEKGLLVEVPIIGHYNNFRKWMTDELEPKGASKYVTLYSHKWSGNNPDDEVNGFTNKVVNRSGSAYCWIDYSCVPQKDQQAKLSHLFAIPQIMAQCWIVAMHANKELESAYDGSIWCQLEAICLSEAKLLKHIPNRKFTIYDWNDLYAVLPGFIELYCDSTNGEDSKVFDFFKHFPYGNDCGWLRSHVLSGILGEFLKFHYN